jgi:hypothetical protein
MKKLLILILLLQAFTGCKNTDALTKTPTKIDQAQVLTEVMTGSYTSAKQAKSDSSYYSISLHMYPVWKSKSGHYLYVEQALASKQQQPYRQRIYHIEALKNGTLTSTLYSLEDEKRFIGKYAEPAFFDQFDESILSEREGCTVYIQKVGDAYVGATKDKECQSSLRGSTYATAEVRIEKDKVISWDRGFDDDDKHVWGAEKGGYIFELIRKQVPNYNKSGNGIQLRDNRKIQVKE